MVRTDASGRLGFTNQTACWISLRKDSVPARSLRTANVAPRVASNVLGPKIPAVIEGQYTIGGAFSWTPFSRTSSTTPTTSNHGGLYWRNRLPSAAEGEPHHSRARFSEIITTGLC